MVFVILKNNEKVTQHKRLHRASEVKYRKLERARNVPSEILGALFRSRSQTSLGFVFVLRGQDIFHLSIRRPFLPLCEHETLAGEAFQYKLENVI